MPEIEKDMVVVRDEVVKTAMKAAEPHDDNDQGVTSSMLWADDQAEEEAGCVLHMRLEEEEGRLFVEFTTQTLTMQK